MRGRGLPDEIQVVAYPSARPVRTDLPPTRTTRDKSRGVIVNESKQNLEQILQK
jgi:hypothetical protein